MSDIDILDEIADRLNFLKENNLKLSNDVFGTEVEKISDMMIIAAEEYGPKADPIIQRIKLAVKTFQLESGRIRN